VTARISGSESHWKTGKERATKKKREIKKREAWLDSRKDRFREEVHRPSSQRNLEPGTAYSESQRGHP